MKIRNLIGKEINTKEEISEIKGKKLLEEYKC
jgi:hypothetical protein